MNSRNKSRSFALTVTGAIGLIVTAVALSSQVTATRAFSARGGAFHGVKACPVAPFVPGYFCSITASSLSAVPVGSNLYYDQPVVLPLSPTGSLLDSNVTLDDGNGSRALGRCTLDFTTVRGLCTFSDGTGTLVGFRAHLNVDCTGGPADCQLDGTYSFETDDDAGR